MATKVPNGGGSGGSGGGGSNVVWFDIYVDDAHALGNGVAAERPVAREPRLVDGTLAKDGSPVIRPLSGATNREQTAKTCLLAAR